MFKILPKFTTAQVKAFLKEQQEIIERKIISRLQYVGEQFISLARQNGTYNDITGNLRSSIGYVILKNGVQISGSFGGNAIGQEAAKEAAKNFGSGYSGGIVLVVVAGMEYAAAVESKGKDVLTGSSGIVIDLLQKSLQSLQKEINKGAA